MKIGVMDRSSEETVYIYVYDRYKTFTEFPEITFIQYEIAVDTDPRAYFLENNIVRFDETWIEPPVAYKSRKAEEFMEGWELFEELMASLAAENSQILSDWVTAEILAGRVVNDGTSIKAAVKPHVCAFAEAFRSMREDVRMYNFYTIEDCVAAVERDTLLRTDARLTEWKDKINAIVWR